MSLSLSLSPYFFLSRFLSLSLWHFLSHACTLSCLDTITPHTFSLSINSLQVHRASNTHLGTSIESLSPIYLFQSPIKTWGDKLLIRSSLPLFGLFESLQPRLSFSFIYSQNNWRLWAAAIAQWIRLRLPSFGPGFRSFKYIMNYYFHLLDYICHCNVKMTKMN